MKKYLVGGSVRDKLLGEVPRDTDYLVLESSHQELISIGLLKVGQSFPIYLDPVTGDEYTLGNSPEDDLHRRDLTINAMAMDEAGSLVDFFGGEADLRNKILKHVAKDNFFTDPLRVMRVARFQARLPDFSIHPETLELMREVSSSEGYQKILSERIIKELKCVFESPKPSLFFKTLKEVGALKPYFPDIDSLSLLDSAPPDEELKFAAWCTEMSPETLESLRRRLNVQNDWYEIGRAWVLYQKLRPSPEELLQYLYDVDAFRKPGLVEKVDKLGGNLSPSFALIRDISVKDLEGRFEGKEISDAIRVRRLAVLKARS